MPLLIIAGHKHSGYHSAFRDGFPWNPANTLNVSPDSLTGDGTLGFTQHIGESQNAMPTFGRSVYRTLYSTGFASIPADKAHSSLITAPELSANSHDGPAKRTA